MDRIKYRSATINRAIIEHAYTTVCFAVPFTAEQTNMPGSDLRIEYRQSSLTPMRARSAIVVLSIVGALVTTGSLFAQDLSFEESVAANSLKRDNYDEAIVIYTKVIARNPRDASAYYDRGVIHLMKGDFPNAIADLTQALQLEPNKVAYYSALAIAYAEEGTKLKRPDDCDKAMAISNEALQHDAWFFSAYGARGWAHLCKAEVTESVSFLDAAIADFTIFIKTTPRNVLAYL